MTAVRRVQCLEPGPRRRWGARDSETDKLGVLQISEDSTGGSLQATDGHRDEPFIGLASNFVPKGRRS